MEANTLYTGDSHELLDRVPNSSVDLIVCDGPYGVTTNE